MKNFRLYLILPAILLVAFLFTPGQGYFSAQKQILAKEKAREEAVEQAKIAEETKRAEIQKRAEQDAIARQKENEAVERAKAEKKRKDYEDAINKLQEDIATFTSESEAYGKEVTELESQLAKLRDRKESENRATFDLSKEVELAKIERRTSELEIQRMVGMVSRTLTSSPLLTPPAPPPAPKKG